MKLICSAVLSLCLFAGAAFGQVNSFTQTTTTAAMGATDGFVYLASVTGVQAGSPQAAVPSRSMLYIISPGNMRGEGMQVQSVNGLQVFVQRGEPGSRTQIPSGATVIVGFPNWFRAYDPSGGCSLASTYIAPWINTVTGSQWLCSAITLSWVPSWENPSDSYAVTAAVASVAGPILPSGPLFHVTGTAAITGITLPVGFVTGSISIIPDGAFTTTTAGNIAIASTAVVNRVLTFTWDSTNSKFVPSY